MRHFFEKTMMERLVKSGLMAFSAKVGSGFLTIALTGLVARLLPPEDVGLFFLSFSTIAMVSIFARFGQDQLAIKLIGKGLVANDIDGVKQLTLMIFKLVGGLTALWVVIGALTFDYLSRLFLAEYTISSLFKLLFLLWLIVTTIQILFSEIFRSFHSIGRASLFAGGTAFGGFGAGLISGIVILLFSYFHVAVTIETILTIIIAVTAVLLLLELILITRMLHVDGEKQKKSYSGFDSTYKNLLSRGFYFLMINISMFSLIHADTIILGFYRSGEEVALYATTTRLVKLVTMSLIVLYEVVAPIVVELHTENKKCQLQRVLRISATIAAIPTTIVLILFIFKSREVLGLLFGDFYKEGANIVVILSIGQLVNVWSGLSGYTLSITGHHKANMYIVSFVATMAIVCCLFFVQEYGAPAVAWIISMAWVVQNLLAVMFTRYLTGVWTHAGIFYSLKELKRYLLVKKQPV